ncbi:MAG: hypothetical protein AB7P21_22585 [Lautropia sp.]
MYIPLKALVAGALLLALVASAHLLFPVLLVVLALFLVRRVWSGLRWSHGDWTDRSWHRRVGVDPWSRFVPTIDGEPLRSAVPPRSRTQTHYSDFA